MKDDYSIIVGSRIKLTNPIYEQFLSEKWEQGIYPDQKEFSDFCKMHRDESTPYADYVLKFFEFLRNYKEGILYPSRWGLYDKSYPLDNKSISEILQLLGYAKGEFVHLKSRKGLFCSSWIGNNYNFYCISEDNNIYPHRLWLAKKNGTLHTQSLTLNDESYYFNDLEFPTRFGISFSLDRKQVTNLPLSFYEELARDLTEVLNGDYAIIRNFIGKEILYKYKEPAERYADIFERKKAESERWLQEKLAKYNEKVAKEKENLKAEEEEENENSSYIVPSAIDENFVYKIKDCKILGLSYNLMQGIKISHNMQKKMKLIIRKDTKLSQDLSDAIRKRKIVIEYVDDILEE